MENRTKRLLREIAKLTNEIDRYLKSNSPKAKKLLKSIAGKARDQGIIIADDLTDAELAEVIRKADKSTKQAIIYAVHNDLPNLKTLHKGKKGFKLDKAFTSGKKLNFALAPDKPVLTQAKRYENKEERQKAAKLRKELKKQAEEHLKENNPKAYAALIAERAHRKSLKKELADEKTLIKLQNKDAKKRAKLIKEKEKERARQEAKRQSDLRQERLDIILEFKQDLDKIKTGEYQFPKWMEKMASEHGFKINKEAAFKEADKQLDHLSKSLGFNKEWFLSLSESELKDSLFTKYLDKITTAEEQIKFLEAIKNANPFTLQVRELNKAVNLMEKEIQASIPPDFYVLPKSKEIPLQVEFKSGLTNEQLESLRDVLDIFKLVADSPEKLTNETMYKALNHVGAFAKLQIKAVELVAKLLSVLNVTTSKIGGDAWDNVFWWFATYKSKHVLDDGHTWVDKGFVVDWKGIHTRVEEFLYELDHMMKNELKDLPPNDDLFWIKNTVWQIAGKLRDHYNKYYNFVEEGPLGIDDGQGNRIFNADAFKQTKQIGETYQGYLMEALNQITQLKEYCKEALKITQEEIKRFARKSYV